MELVKPFFLNGLIKAVTPGSDDMIVHGPIAPAGEDYDTDILTKAGILTGMPMFRKMNSHVDWNHMFDRTQDPKWLIGKAAEDYIGEDGMPWLKTRLYKSSDIARDFWSKLNDEGVFGYSLKGLLRRRDPKDKRKIIETEIHRMTIAPGPKGFGNFLRPGDPARTAAALAKAICSDGECFSAGRIPSGWSQVPESLRDGHDWDDYVLGLQKGMGDTGASCPDCGGAMECPSCASKALTTGSGIVAAGTKGGAALRTQFMAGDNQETIRCRCGARNRASRTECRECGRPLRKQSRQNFVHGR